MRNIIYVSSLTAGEPLEKGRYFTGLTKLRRWLESGGAPLAGYRRIFSLYTHRGIPDYREHPDFLVHLRRSLYPLYVWLRVELSPDFKAIQLRTGMASHTGADAGWGRILWTVVGRAFIYVIPAWLVLYLFKPWEVSLSLGMICFIIAGLGFIFFEYTLISSALIARGLRFRAELARLHDGATERIAEELGLELLSSRQITGPGVDEEPPPHRTATDEQPHSTD